MNSEQIQTKWCQFSTWICHLEMALDASFRLFWFIAGWRCCRCRCFLIGWLGLTPCPMIELFLNLIFPSLIAPPALNWFICALIDSTEHFNNNNNNWLFIWYDFCDNVDYPASPTTTQPSHPPAPPPPSFPHRQRDTVAKLFKFHQFQFLKKWQSPPNDDDDAGIPTELNIENIDSNFHNWNRPIYLPAPNRFNWY